MTRSIWLMIASFGATQYLGLVFIMAAMAAILRQNGASLEKLALINIVAIPLVGKVFYAVLVDRFRLFFQGQYRGWLIIAQSLMILILLVMGMLNINEHFSLILAMAFVFALIATFQDIALDGLSCKLFDEDNRPLANSLQLSGNMLGTVIGGGISLMLYPLIQWQGVVWMLATLTCLSLFQIIAFREPYPASDNFDGDLETTSVAMSFSSLFSDCKSFVKEHAKWFFILTISPISFSMAFSILTPVLVDTGWLIEDIGFSLRVVGSLVGVVSALFAVPIMNRFGRKSAVLILTLATVLSLLLILPITLGNTSKLMVYIAIIAYFSTQPALLAIYATLAMDKAANKGRKATLFTLQFSFFSMMGFVYSSISLMLAKMLGYTLVVVIAIGLSVGVIILLHKILPSDN